MLKTLRAATFEVLETMFFLFPESPEGVEPHYAGMGIQARVPVKGPRPFAVGLTVPAGLARQMGANFLGISADQLSPEMLDDVVRELANMIVGTFLVRSRASAAFQLMPPMVEHLELRSHCVKEPASQLFLDVADYGLEIFLDMTPRHSSSAQGGRQPEGPQTGSPN